MQRARRAAIGSLGQRPIDRPTLGGTLLGYKPGPWTCVCLARVARLIGSTRIPLEGFIGLYRGFRLGRLSCVLGVQIDACIVRAL